MARGSMTVAKCVPMPLLASGNPKMACSSAMRVSQASASSNPPATAAPLIMSQAKERSRDAVDLASAGERGLGPR
jgi:hypothetical protein